MSAEINKLLENAASRHSTVRIIYRGGSQPGRVRDIIPILVTSNEVRAKDISTGIEKTFIISKIEIPSPTEHAKEYDPSAGPQTEEFRTIKEAFESKIAELSEIGWHVNLTRDEIGLYRHFKNGKLRKTPDIVLIYSEYAIDFVYDIDTDQIVEEKRKAVRPYRLDAPGFSSGHTFQKLSNAINHFFEEARKFPRNAG